MVDTTLLDIMSEQVPKMNEELCNGVAINQVAQCEQYLNDVLRGAAESLPAGLTFTGLSRIDPYEEFIERVRSPTHPHKCRTFELSRSDVYMVRLDFRFQNREMRPRYINLPFIREGAIMYLKDTQYEVSPILGGKIFNIERNSVYMWVDRARVVFSKVNHTCMINDRAVHSEVVYSPLYNVREASDGSKLASTLVHYILAKYGLTGMLKRFHKVAPKIGGVELDELAQNGEWFVYSSAMLSKGGPIRIAISAKDHTEAVQKKVASVFYIIDHCPEAIQVEDMDQPELWIGLLPRFIFKDVGVELIAYAEMVTHLASVEQYMDPVLRSSLHSVGIISEDIYDLFSHMISHFQDMLIHHDAGSMYGLEMSTVRHLMASIVHSIFTLVFELRKYSDERITENNITRAMYSNLTKDRIYMITKHGELSANQTAADCKVFGTTCNLVPQAKAAASGPAKKSKTKIDLTDPNLLLHRSQPEVATYQMMSKSDPTGRAKANCFLTTFKRYIIAQNPELEEYIEHFGRLIERN